MRQLLRWQLVVLLLFCSSPANAGDVGVDLNIHLGNAPRGFYIDDDVNFIYPSPLGFYVAVGLPYDLFYAGKSYYLFHDGYWHRARHSRGPWVIINHRDLPPGLRKHKIDRLRYYRDREYEIYRHDERNYRGKHFRSHKDEWRESREEKHRGEREKHRPHKEGKRDR